MQIAIAGAGVGGLAAGIALSRLGHDVRIYERAAALRSSGGALMIWTNAMLILERWGLAEAIHRAGSEIDFIDFQTDAGEPLSELPIGEAAPRHGAATIVIPRRELIGILASALSPGAIELGAPCASFTVDDRVEVLFENGRRVTCDALIGADGLHSAVRRQIVGDPDPLRDVGYEAWVGIAEGGFEDVQRGRAVGTLGRGLRFWCAPLAGGRVYWYAVVDARTASEIADRVALAELFSSWPAPIALLIETTAEAELLRVSIRDRRPSRRWSLGPVVLLGDAAHPTTPDLGQGACQAIESAAVLADALVQHQQPAEAWRAYEARRAERTRTINELSWTTAKNSLVKNPLLCRLRNAGMRALMRSIAIPQLEWLFAGA